MREGVGGGRQGERDGGRREDSAMSRGWLGDAAPPAELVRGIAAVYAAFVQAARGSRDTFLKALLRRFDAAATLPLPPADSPDLQCGRHVVHEAPRNRIASLRHNLCFCKADAGDVTAGTA